MKPARPAFATTAVLLATLLAGPAFSAGDVNYQPDPLEPGRHPMIPHDHTPEASAKLKQNIPTLATVPDKALHMIMNMMRSDYAWYVSPDGTRGKVGVLLLNHGVSEPSDQAFRRQVMPIAQKQPTAIAFGMAMTTNQALQQAIDDLNAQEVDVIVAVDPDTSEHKSLYRQWNYILGLRDKAAYVDVPQVKSKAPILMAEPVNGSPLIAKILLDHARDLSKNEKKEAVIVIAHGPEDNVDNEPDLAEIRKLTAWMKKKSRFASIEALNVQDDAPREVRAANVKTFRKLVTDAQARNETVIVVPYVTNAVGLQPKLQKDLEGLTFLFQEKGISDHKNFNKWIEQSVKTTVKQARR